MKDFIDKLIGRLEELKTFKLDLADAMSELMKKDRLDNYISKEEVIEIVNQLAEEYAKDINVTTIDAGELFNVIRKENSRKGNKYVAQNITRITTGKRHCKNQNT